MALYEYACTSCDHRFERIMKRGARAPRCPECGAATKRQISAPAIHFKGTGWYVTDYAGKGKKEPSGGSKTGAGKSDSKKDVKPSAGKEKSGKGSGGKTSGDK